MAHEGWNDPETLRKIYDILLPYAARKIRKLKRTNGRFVHYTSAATGIDILTGNGVWLRDISLMNDYSEVEHGWTCLLDAWNDQGLGQEFIENIEQIDPGSTASLATNINAQIDEMKSETYMLAISEHSVREDSYGRLSMWRAYGAPTGVALVLNNIPFVNPSDALHAYTSPVLYADPSGFTAKLRQALDSMKSAAPYLKANLPPGYLALFVQEVLRALVLSTKHPGFHEEREWRVIYSPARRPSPHIEGFHKSVHGIPQRIYKIPFVNHPNEGFVGATVPELLNRVIIGPTAHPAPICKAYLDVLTQLNVPDAADRIFVSGVPLRQA